MKNDQLNLIKIFFLISGILNICYALGWGGYSIIGGLITCGIGCLFGIVPIINVIACVMDFMAYNKINRMDRTGTFSTIQFAAIFDIVSILSGNFGSMILGIITLVMLNNPETGEELKKRGIY